MKKTLLLGCVVLLIGCHPFFMFKAPTLTKSLGEAKKSDATEVVNIVLDDFGIPFIKAKTTEAAMYALGFMHAYDRLFQLDLIRHAALGRTSELFGQRTLALDKKLRILSYRLDEQLLHLTHDEQLILRAYVAGINEGARKRGRSTEHFLLGTHFKDFALRDVVAIARLQSWQLAQDLNTEIDRLIIARSSLSDVEKQSLLNPVEDRNSSIIPLEAKGSARNKKELSELFAPLKATYEILDEEMGIIQSTGGASNAWVVAGNLMENKHSVLMNDPHLRHTWPSNFYLAGIETDEMSAKGASLVGVPSIVIGAGKHIAWGVTASYLNTQDTVLLKRDKKNKLKYLVDNKSLELEKWPQEFCLAKNEGCRKEDFYVSIFGPVMDTRHDSAIAKEDFLALMWTGFLIEKHSAIATTFVKLASAKNVGLGTEAIKAMTFPGVNLVITDTAGAIAYAYAGLVPQRDNKQFPFLPLDGGKSSSLWSAFLSKPFLINPNDGVIITANQNIYNAHAAYKKSFGKQGAAPYRALKIKENIETLLKQGELKVEELAKIQLDSVSIEAKEIAPQLGRICQEEFKNGSALQKEFALKLSSFDGNFTTDSKAALPYEMMMDMIIGTRLHEAVGPDLVKKIFHNQQLRYAVKNALLEEFKGNKTGLFGDRMSFQKYIARLCEPSLNELVKKAGSAPWKWRYGRHHYLKRESTLAKAPVVGGFFRDKRREVAGSGSSPLAEIGMPVVYGANLRFQAIMSDPPVLRAVLDTGTSGDRDHENSLDQSLLWHQGKLIDLAKDWSEAETKAKSRFYLSF